MSEARRSRITDESSLSSFHGPPNRIDIGQKKRRGKEDTPPLSGSKREFGDYGFISWKCSVDKYAGQQMYVVVVVAENIVFFLYLTLGGVFSFGFVLKFFLTRYGEFFHEGNENVTRTIGVLLDMDRGIIAYTNDGISGKTSSWGKHITDNMGIAHRFVRSGGQAASRNSLNSYEGGGGGGGVVAGRKRQTLWPTFIFTKVAHKNEFQVDMPELP